MDAFVGYCCIVASINPELQDTDFRKHWDASHLELPAADDHFVADISRQSA
jgi:hypothetical protein